MYCLKHIVVCLALCVTLRYLLRYLKYLREVNWFKYWYGPTSVFPLSHVKPSFILDKIVRFLFPSSVIQLAYFTSYDVIVALTCDFVVAKHQTFVRVLHPFWFIGVTLESLSTHRLLSWVTLGTSSHEQRDQWWKVKEIQSWEHLPWIEQYCNG